METRIGYSSRTFTVYGVLLFWIMCSTMHLSFTWFFPEVFAYVLAIIVGIWGCMAFSERKVDNAMTKMNLILFVYLFYLICVSHGNFLVSIVKHIGIFFTAVSIILLPDWRKEKLLSIILSGTAAFLLVSIFFWIIHLCGFSLPHTGRIEFGDNFHEFYNYHFFLVSSKAKFVIFPRFMSFFLEPGQLATPCALLFFANGGKIKDWRCIVLLIAIGLSFSLAGFVMIFSGFFLKMIIQGKGVIVKLLLAIMVFGGGAYYIYNQANEDNPLYSLIFSRLEYDEENGIAGNNRTTEYFDYKFDKMMQTNDRYLGIASKIDSSNDWTANTSGYKKYIVYFGLIGFALVMITLLMMMLFNKNRYSLIFFIIVLIGFLPRTLLPTPFWLFIIILGFYLSRNYLSAEKSLIHNN